MTTNQIWISPHYKNTDFKPPLSLDDKIEIFYDSVMGWQLDIADQCINGRTSEDGTTVKAIPHSGFAVLHIVLSYFELIAKYQAGFTQEGQSKRYFKRGFRSVFSELGEETGKIQESIERALDKLYYDARCGLYHSGMTGSSVTLSGGPPVPVIIDPVTPQFLINPHRFVTVLKEHLIEYMDTLRNPDNEDERANFEHRFDYDHRMEDYVLRSKNWTDLRVQ